jgi:hypothetical protein
MGRRFTPFLLTMERQSGKFSLDRDERTLDDLLPHAVTRAGMSLDSRITRVGQETTDDE